MLSKSEPAKGQPGKVAVDKQEMIDLLAELNKGVYAIMDEYELTTQSRDRAERVFQKQGEDIVRNANRKAEDIYAASVMYTDEALSRVQEIMRKSAEELQNIHEEMDRKLKEEIHTVKSNQLELKSQLQDLVDTDKYLKLIDDRNREIEREKARKDGQEAPSESVSIYANRQTEVRVNKAYLQKLGLADPDDVADGDGA
jgi:prolyl oligopeptidase PreP (S9A serine peptidase family)